MKKAFIDCGANRGQSIDLFIDGWKNSIDYEIHSFEANKDFEEKLNSRVDKYRSRGHSISAYVPVAAWDKETEEELSIFGAGESGVVSDRNEAQLHRSVVLREARDFKPSSIRLSSWIKEKFSPNDYIILKLDVEGSEYRLIKDLDKTGVLKYLNLFFYEWHGPKKGFSYKDDIEALETLQRNDIKPFVWNGNNPESLDMKEVNKELIDNWYERRGFKTKI